MANDIKTVEVDAAAASFLPLSAKDYHVLMVLLDDESHGYGMVKEIEERTDGRISLEAANLYRVIRRLIRDGLVAEADRRATPETEQEERRRYYRITALGREVVALEAERMRALVDEARSRAIIADSTEAK
ncbi:MAG: PadR family transcriptional regulator [Acidobacteriota bacterium]|jgi:DNA-binding PadR family transcriptional regulator